MFSTTYDHSHSRRPRGSSSLMKGSYSYKQNENQQHVMLSASPYGFIHHQHCSVSTHRRCSIQPLPFPSVRACVGLVHPYTLRGRIVPFFLPFFLPLLTFLPPEAKSGEWERERILFTQVVTHIKNILKLGYKKK